MTENSAIGDRREQIQGQERPARLNADFSIKEAVQGVRDTTDLWKLYTDEWIVVYTSSAEGALGELECRTVFDKKYEGRVRKADVKFEPASAKTPTEYPFRLLLRLPNIKGEFKTLELAEAHAESNFETWKIVTRNSREDYAIRDYSVKKLTLSQLADE